MHSFPSLFSTALYLTAPGKAELATALFSLLTAPAALTTIPGLPEKKKFTCTISFRCQMPHFQMIYESPHLFSTSKISGTEVPHTPKENLSLAHRHWPLLRALLTLWAPKGSLASCKSDVSAQEFQTRAVAGEKLGRMSPKCCTAHAAAGAQLVLKGF